MVKRLDAEHKEFITNLLPEVRRRSAAGRQAGGSVTAAVARLTGACRVFQVIICTKEVSAGARKSAYNLLVEIGNAFVRFCGSAKGNSPVSASVRERFAITWGTKLFSSAPWFSFSPSFVLFSLSD